MSEEGRLIDLRDDVERLLAAALDSGERHDAELRRRDELHIAETARRDLLHVSEIQRRDDLHVHEIETIRQALDTRDLIGQAKGVLMGAMACSADRAFQLLKSQSQHENRKLVEIAAEVAARASASVPHPGLSGDDDPG